MMVCTIIIFMNFHNLCILGMLDVNTLCIKTFLLLLNVHSHISDSWSTHERFANFKLNSMYTKIEEN